LRGLRFIGLSEDIREALAKDVDVIDVSHIKANSPIEKEVRKTGVILYDSNKTSFVNK
jgi:hypothetical protein